MSTMIKMTILDKQPEYLVGEFHGSNLFWDESDHFADKVTVERIPSDEQYSVGETVIVTMEERKFDCELNPMKVMMAGSPTNNCIVWKPATISDNRITPSIDANPEIYFLLIGLGLLTPIMLSLWFLRKLDQLSKKSFER